MSTPLIEPLESRQLCVAILAITTVTASATTVTTASSFSATIGMSNAGGDPGILPAAAELFLVPQGSSLNATTNPHVFYSFKPIYAKTTRTLSKSIVTKSIAPGTYTLNACPFNTLTNVADTTKPVVGPTVTIIAPPVAGDLTATLALPSKTNYPSGGSFVATLSLTHKTTLTTDVPVTFYLSTDPTFSDKDTGLPAQTFTTSFTAGKPTAITCPITLPKNKKGTFYLIAVINKKGVNPALPTKVIAVSPGTIKIK